MFLEANKPYFYYYLTCHYQLATIVASCLLLFLTCHFCSKRLLLLLLSLTLLLSRSLISVDQAAKFAH